MGKVYIDSVKYTVYASVEVDCIVEKSDVVGAIFGQTEGLLGEELDLRDLQKNGRIGRIEVTLTHNKGKTLGEIKIPSSLDLVETAVIAAAIETVDRVGPCEARIAVTKVEDNRTEKRKKVIERAQQLLKEILNTQIPDSRELTELVRQKMKEYGLTYYGKDKLPAGPLVESSDEIILVEGRADVLNLIRNDILNAIAIGGARIPESIVELTKAKETTVFLDGDRGGDIILRELVNAGADIDYLAKAPHDKEVEELTRKEIMRALRARVKFEEEFLKRKEAKRSREKGRGTKEAKEEEKVKEAQPSKEVEEEEEKKDLPAVEVSLEEEQLKAALEEMRGSLKARFFSAEGKLVDEIPVKDLRKYIMSMKEGPAALVFDGIITQRLLDWAHRKGITYVVGLRQDNVKKIPEGVHVITL